MTTEQEIQGIADNLIRKRMRGPSGSLEMHEVGREIEEDGCGEWFRLPLDMMARIAQEAA